MLVILVIILTIIKNCQNIPLREGVESMLDVKTLDADNQVLLSWWVLVELW